MRFESPAGSHLVGVWYGGAATFDLASDVVVSGADVGPISATMTAGYWITGHVFRPDGITPVADAFVNVQLSGGACCANTAWVTNTDASGVYHVAVPGGASYIVQANPQNATDSLLWQWYNATLLGTRDFSLAIAIPVAAADVGSYDLVLQQGYRISGTVTGAGAPLRAVQVSAQDAVQPCCTWVNGTQTQADGSYVLIAPAGSFKVFFDATALGHGTQYYNGAALFGSATTVTVGPGGASGVNATLP